MPQIAYTDAQKTTAHLVITLGVGVTLCERRAVDFGKNLPISRDRWPDLPWCQECVDAYG